MSTNKAQVKSSFPERALSPMESAIIYAMTKEALDNAIKECKELHDPWFLLGFIKPSREL